MPNHVKNVVKFIGSEREVKVVLERIAEDGKEPGIIDFNKIRMMPETLDVESGSNTQTAIEAVLKALEHDSCYWTSQKLGSMTDEEFKRRSKQSGKSFDELRRLGLQYITNKVLYGHTTWYGWCCENWGTKWNAYERGCDGDTIYFETAWSAPHPVIEELARLSDTIKIEHEWADEDIGSNCGRRFYENGECVDEFFPNDGREAIEFACNLWGYDVDEYIVDLEAEGNEVSRNSFRYRYDREDQ